MLNGFANRVAHLASANGKSASWRGDTDGYIHLMDRMSNTIIGGGKNIDLSEVEGVSGAFPRCKDVAVIGVPDAKWGEAVMAIFTATTS